MGARDVAEPLRQSLDEEKAMLERLLALGKDAELASGSRASPATSALTRV